MPHAAGAKVDDLLARWRQGDPAALDALLPLVYADLRRLASAHLRRVDGHTTLQTTALVNEVLMRLLERPPGEFEDLAHLFNAIAKMMRCLLVNRAREAAAAKRGGGWQRDELLDTLELPIPQTFDVHDLDQALEQLEAVDSRMAAVVELRCFVGLSVGELAQLFDVGERTIQRDWSAALVWLKRRLAA